MRKLKLKDGVSRMLSLEEYLQIVSKYGEVAVIEIKNRMPEKNIGEIISICKEWDNPVKSRTKTDGNGKRQSQ